MVARNVFWDVDHAVNLKNATATIFENNTVVRVHDDFTDRFGNPNLGSAINFFVDEPGATAGTGAYAAGNIFWDAPRVFGNVDQANTTSVLEFHQNLLSRELAGTSIGARPGSLVDLGHGHLVADPRFADELLGEFELRLGSAALGTGPLGIDMGAAVPNRIVVSGQPAGVTGSPSATVTVGGPGMFAFRYRINGGPWSDDLPIGAGYDVSGTVRTAQFQLSGLDNGTQLVEVIGQDFAGQWQAEPTRATWTVASTTPQLVISEVLVSNVDALDNDGTRPDYIELQNVGGAPVNLNGYRLSDDPNRLAKFTFETDLIVPGGDYVVLYADDLLTSPGIHLGFGLDRDGEGVYLSAPVAAGGQMVDAVEFGPQIADLSISRVGPDQVWHLSIATPGTLNQPQPTGDPSTLKINEWLASHSDLNDFIELYNPDPLPVALDGLYLTDELGGAPTLQQIRPQSYVAGHGFVALARDRSDNLTFKLSADQEGIALLDQNQTVVDVVFYYPQTHQWSQGRNPDGMNAYGFFATPSPGRRNVSGIPGDMNFDGAVNADDIDLLAAAVRQGSTDLAFDLDGNEAVEADDLTFLVESILNTRAGDTDLDGDVDFTDFVALAENFGSASAGWMQGNFDLDGRVDFADFVSLAANFGFEERLLAVAAEDRRSESAFVHSSEISRRYPMPSTLAQLGQILPD